MSKRIRTTVGIVAALVSWNSYSSEGPEYVGTWRSNEAMTIESMEATEGIPEEKREFFRNNFFGKLVVIVRKYSSASYFIDEKPIKLTYEKHTVTVIDKNKIRVKSYNPELEYSSDDVLTFIGDCYYLPVSKWQFREYFCRVQESS